ncbi:MAG: radical SAM family heme chaperone HemW [Bacteroidaceae bacterium]|nr:radical SAM family heme chaperone HemW [Bacteroidaceae bacterium]
MHRCGLYIHVPFCKSRCIYCDFYSTTCGSDIRKAYVEAVCREITLRKEYLDQPVLNSVYIGGGTPSVLTAEELSKIFATIAEHWQLSSNAEVTLEANPDDITPDYAKALAALPINRVSMGVQTFNDDILRFLHRRHTAEQVHQAVDSLLSAGISNISIDLIYGLPNQTIDLWQSDLEQALALPVSHLSAYSLTYEEGTPLFLLREQGKVRETDEDLSLQMYSLLMEKAEAAGFHHYEISNFALPGYEARHNSGYWSGMHYLGIGPAAHSYNGTSRQWNSHDLHTYIKAAGDVFAANLFFREELSPKMQMEEMLLTRLRTAAGLDLTTFAHNFGTKERDALLTRANPYINNGQLNIVNRQQTTVNGQWSMVNGQCLSLTRKGLFVSDDIISSLFED